MIGDPVDTRSPKPRLGLDLYSLRSQAWSAFQYLDFCAGQGAEVAHFSALSFLGGLDRPHLDRVRAHAEALGLAVEVGIGSVCETSSSYAPEDGPAARQLNNALEIANILGSPIVRCFLGSSEDREGNGVGVPLAPQSSVPLRRHIQNVIRACRAVEDRARALGIRIAIENHVGDLHSTELMALIEEAGPDYVGALLDTGNATWALETPDAALDTLGASVIATHIRDSSVWEVPEGLAVRWCPFGRGNVSLDTLADRLAALAPGAAFTLEVINRPSPRVFAWRRPDFWRSYESVPARGFGLLLEAARSAPPYLDATRDDRPPAEIELMDVTDSLRYAREVLGLGRQPPMQR